MLKNSLKKVLIGTLISGSCFVGMSSQVLAGNQPTYSTLGAERTTEVQIFSNWNKTESDGGDMSMTMIYLAGKHYINDAGTRLQASYMTINTDSNGSTSTMNEIEVRGRFPLGTGLGMDEAMDPEFFVEGSFGLTTDDYTGETATDMAFGGYAGIRLSLGQTSSLTPGAGLVLDKYDSKRNRNDTETVVLFTEYKFFPYEDGKLSLDVDFERRTNSEVTTTDLQAGFTIRF